MCGICGIVSKEPINGQTVSLMEKISSKLEHRGPDSNGFYSSGNVALAMRRLKIIDLDGGDQPLFSEDGSLVLVGNGEIYNHIELRNMLEAKGHRFASRSDCETIIHLYEDKGAACLDDLRGMFAFALYDSRSKKLFIARDRLGEKPLYYCHTGKEIIFASEMKAILAWLRPHGVEIDGNSFNLYLHYNYVPEPLTCVKGVSKLPAAHFLMIDTESCTVALKSYWNMESAAPVDGDPAKMIRDAFDDVARIIIRADVPVGVSLSGGIDSSAVAVFARKYSADSMHAFSVGYPGRPANDEREMAQSLAKKLGFIFHDLELKTEDFVQFFPEMVYCMDDPIADIAAFGYYSVSKAAREHGVPVLLSGLGGDELFWGYDWVVKVVKKNMALLSAREGQLKYHPITAAFHWILENCTVKQLSSCPHIIIKHFFMALSRERARFENPDRFIFYDEIPNFITAQWCVGEIVSDEFGSKIRHSNLYSFFENADWSNIPIKICKLLFNTWLYSNCIALGDRMSMANSVEMRLPVLDYRFVELVMGLRKSFPDHNLGYKRWFKDAMRGIVPDDVLDRKKMGFTPPVVQWYSAIVDEYGCGVEDGMLVAMGLIDRKRVAEFIKKASPCNGSLFVAYKIVLFDMWCRKIVEENGP